MPSRLRRPSVLALTLALVASLTPSIPVATALAGPTAVSRQSPAGNKAQRRTDRVLIQFADTTLTAGHVSQLAAAGVDTRTLKVSRRGVISMKVPRGKEATAFAGELAKRPGVRLAAPDQIVQAEAMSLPPNDTYYSNAFVGISQRSYLGPLSVAPHGIDLEPAWQQAFNGSDHALDPWRSPVTLAIVDTGFSSSTQENGSGAFVAKRNEIDGTTNTFDDNGHGTTVGMLMHATAQNAYGITGIQGPLPSKVLVYKALDANGSGYESDCVQGVEDAADAGAKVINCSFGGPAGSASLTLWNNAVAYAKSKGAIVVAAAGNESAPVDTPGAANGAVAVGSIDTPTGARSSFSNYGPQLSFVTPGQHILEFTGPVALGGESPNSVAAGAGTSYSSPMAAASIGLLWSLVPGASPATIMSAITATCRDLGAAGRDDYYGAGELDVWAAYQRLMATVPTQASPSVSVSGTPGFTTTIKWPALPGSGVTYRYRVNNGGWQLASGDSATLWFGADGVYQVAVRGSASDMFSSAPTVITITVATGRAPLTVTRFAGVDRYDTAARVSLAGHPSGASTVIVASGEDFPDALSASVLAKVRNAPLLLTHAGSLPSATSREIQRLHPSTAIIVGGTHGVSDGVKSAIQRLVPNTVQRLAGLDRYETAEKVALAVHSAEGSGASATVVLASGENFPDALSASAFAAAAGDPILLTRSGTLPAATSRALRTLRASRTIVVGGTGAVSASVMSATPSAVRLGGLDRYATARAVADAAVGSGVLTDSHLGIATGRNFPDALAGGVLMSQLRGPLLLADGSSTDLDKWLTAAGDKCGTVDVFGSDGVVSTTLVTQVAKRLRGL